MLTVDEEVFEWNPLFMLVGVCSVFIIRKEKGSFEESTERKTKTTSLLGFTYSEKDF